MTATHSQIIIHLLLHWSLQHLGICATKLQNMEPIEAETEQQTRVVTFRLESTSASNMNSNWGISWFLRELQEGTKQHL